MNVRRLVITTASALAVFLSSPAAHADGFVTPFVGVNFGGSTDEELANAIGDNSRLNWGVALGFMGGGIIGFEEEFAYSPKFFAEGAGVGQVNLLTLMSNLMIGIPIGGQKGGGVRPYVVGGLGLLRTDVDQASSLFNASDNRLAFDVGGGLMIYFANHVGIRGDYRYFRDLKTFADTNNPISAAISKGNLNFSRASVGLILRF